jgi:hypothetical protein
MYLYLYVRIYPYVRCATSNKFIAMIYELEDKCKSYAKCYGDLSVNEKTFPNFIPTTVIHTHAHNITTHAVVHHNFKNSKLF